MNETQARNVAAIINKRYKTDQAEALRHKTGWIVVLGPDYSRWYSELDQIARDVVSETCASIKYTVQFSPPSSVSAIYLDD